jgi:hypothetical protein
MLKIILFSLLFLGYFKSDAQNVCRPDHILSNKFLINSLKNEKSFMISHSLSQIIDPTTSVSCNNFGLHYENSYYRVFDLNNEFEINGDWIVQNIDIAIGQAESGNGLSQPGKLILYVMSEYNNEIIPDSLTLLVDTIDFEVFDFESGSIKNIMISEYANIVFGKSLVVEVLIPDGQEDGNSLFLGSNDLGETDSTYIKAPHCGINTPVPMSDIMFPDMNLVMNVYGEYSNPDPQILSFSIEGQLTQTKILSDTENLIFKVDVIMPADTTLYLLTPQIQIPAGFQIIPGSGEIVDFSNGPVIYNVNNNFIKISRDWTVSVKKAGPEIIACLVANQNGETIIDTLYKTVQIPVPLGTDLSNISPYFTLYQDFEIIPPSETSQDFSSGPVTYTVSHNALPISQDWQVTVFEFENIDVPNHCIDKFIISPNPANDIIEITGADFVKFEIYTMTGSMIISSNYKERIDISYLNPGLYIIMINSREGFFSHKILVY